MERIDAANSRVVALSTLLETPRRNAATESAISAPDPKQQLEQERTRILEDAFKTGYAEGLKRADDEIRSAVAKAEQRIEAANSNESQRLQQDRDQLRQLLANLPEAISRADQQMDAVVVEAVFAAVTRVLGEAAAKGSLIEDVCRQALDEFQQRPATVRVSMDEVETVSGLADADALRVLGDARLLPGQCRLETYKGVYDSGVEVRLEALKQALVRSLHAGSGGK